MPQTDRETIDNALFTLLVNSYAWATSSRRWQIWTQIQAASQPALFLVRQTEEVAYAGRGMPRAYTIKYLAIVYCSTGNDPTAVPATELNAVLDAIDRAIPPSNGPAPVTLGLPGVQEVRIRGVVKTDEGSLGPQAFALVPIEIVAT